MKELFSLGELYVSDFLKSNETPRGGKSELKLMMDDNGAVRLEKTAPLDTMFGTYWYRSGINATMKNELRGIVESITGIVKLKDSDLWIDIASNDGTLLSFLPKNLLKVGIDPADDSFKAESEKHADLIIQDYFSAEVFKKSKFGGLKAKVVTSIAMFYDLERPESFIKDVDEVLDDNGVWVLQLSYSPLMINQVAFDNICFKKDTLVMGANKKISELRKGDVVLDSKGQFTKVVKNFENDYNGNMIDIKAKYVEKIQCTPEHPILVVKNNNIDNKKSEWIDAKNVEKGDYLLIPKIKTKDINRIIDLSCYNNSASSKYRRGLKSIKLTLDVLWMMGLYVAEGWISGKENNLQINFCLNINETNYVDRLKKIFKSFGYKASNRDTKLSHSTRVQASCTALAKIFRIWFGEGAKNKKIPDFLFSAKPKIIIPFLKGLINGDGYINKKNQIGLHSASKTLINQVQLMLATINCVTGISYVKPYDRTIRGLPVKSSDSWQLRGTNKFLTKCLNNKNNHLHGDTIHFKYDENYIYVKVMDIGSELYSGKVYNIETESNTYVVSNIAVHNCHEHVYYYSLFNLKSLLEKNGFRIMDCQLNDINGGSFRVYCMKQSSNGKNFSSQPYRDICNFRIESLLEYEKTLKLDQVETWQAFFKQIEELKETTVSFIKAEKAKGKTIMGYGASTKGNTLLQYFGLDNTLIDAIAERSPAKFGLKTVGTNIPIISEDEFRKRTDVDYILILPWHFIDEFITREKLFLQKGGAFIVPCPKFEIIKI